MATAPVPDLLDAEPLFLGVVMSRGLFRVPVNQRPWSWSKENIETLLSDVLDGRDRFYTQTAQGNWRAVNATSRLPHFLGSVVVLNEGSTSPQGEPLLEVVDGQQRLTLLVMTARALLEACVDLAKQATSDRSALTKLTNGLSGWVEVNGSPRLALDDEFDDFFQKYTVRGVDATSRRAVLKSYAPRGTARLAAEKPVVNDLRQAQDRVLAWVVSNLTALPGRPQQVSWLKSVVTTLQEHVAVLLVTVTDYRYGLAVFRSLNSTGVGLDQADNIKNELFRRSDRSVASKIREGYVHTLRELPSRDINGYLRARQASFGRLTPMRRLYQSVVDNELPAGADIRTVVRTWMTEAELVHAFDHPEAKWTQPGIVRALVGIREIDVRYCWVHLLAAADRYLPGSPLEFQKHCQLALAFAFRKLTVKQSSRVAPLDEVFTRVAGMLRAGKSTVAVTSALRLESTDIEFASDFAQFTPNTRVRRYVLAELERSFSGGTALTLPDIGPGGSVDVEHILPERFEGAPAGSWAGWRDQAGNPTDEHKKFVRYIGNTVLLESGINSKLNSMDWSAKAHGNFPPGQELVDGKQRPSYADSAYQMPKKLAALATPVWDQAAMAAWHLTLADEAKKIWKL